MKVAYPSIAGRSNPDVTVAFVFVMGLLVLNVTGSLQSIIAAFKGSSPLLLGSSSTGAINTPIGLLSPTAPPNVGINGPIGGGNAPVIPHLPGFPEILK